MPQETAHRFYPSSYKIMLNQENLRDLKQSEFSLFPTDDSKKLHRISELTLWPFRKMLHLLARAVQPNPGANKDQWLRGIGIQILCLLGVIGLLPFAIISLPLGLSLRAYNHRSRPAISYLEHNLATIPEQPNMSKVKPLHVRTHNVGFVPTCMGTVGDLRDPNERAAELVLSINNDYAPPDLICFQETFNEDATEILCRGINKNYPYIIHDIAPHISGLSSGAMIASKYPLKEIQFIRLKHMVSPDDSAPRGIVRARLATQQGDILIYSIHTQSLIGEHRASARNQQIRDVSSVMEQDARNEDGIHQVVMGDFNTSQVTAWRENNSVPENQAEAAVLQTMDESFVDPFLKDHDKTTGHRTNSTAFFSSKDSSRLKEPTGSWYYGPFANKGTILTLKERLDRWRHGRDTPELVEQIKAPEKVTWGTPEWDQSAFTARFDYILFSRTEKNRLDAQVEIRRVAAPDGAQSAATDHLPVDALISCAMN